MLHFHCSGGIAFDCLFPHGSASTLVTICSGADAFQPNHDLVSGTATLVIADQAADSTFRKIIPPPHISDGRSI
jgi:hypothetical protein